MSYLGFDTLTINYNRVGSVAESIKRKFALLSGATGKRVADEQSPAPGPVRPFTWMAIGMAEIAEMRSFLQARKGRAVPFWMPSYQWDLSLAEDLLEDDAIMNINFVRYQQQMFGTTAGRRHLALWNLGVGSFDFYKVGAATDPGDGITESLSLDPGAVRLYSKAVTVVSFLKLCRLEEDSVEIVYPGRGVAEATIKVRELPLEAPL